MDIVGLIAVAFLVFGLGWITGNIVDWVIVARERRRTEERNANNNYQMWLEDRETRE